MISYKKAMEKTIVEIDTDFLDEMWSDCMSKLKGELVPPLFDEFVIVSRKKNGAKKLAQTELSARAGFLSLPKEEQETKVKEVLKNITAPFSYDTTDTFYIKYHSATAFDILVFEGCQHRKTALCEVRYTATENDDKMAYYTRFNNLSSNVDTDLLEEHYKTVMEYIVGVVFVVSYYMQHYNPTISYTTIKADELKSNSTDKIKDNNGFSQKIKLKSTIKKYVIDQTSDETNRQRIKEIKYTKPCWYVRGYYQRYGKGKIIKYVPPRINYRKDINKDQKPKTNKYELN